MESEKAIVKKIRAYYDDTPKPVSKIDTLKSLDKKVRTPAIIFAYVFGVIGSLVLGTGMCLAMSIFTAGTFWLVFGIAIGIIGIVMVSVTYMLYNRLLTIRRRMYSKEIIELSNELLNK